MHVREPHVRRARADLVPGALSVSTHAVYARHPSGACPATRAAVAGVVRHRDAPPGAAQPAERAPSPARAAVARAAEHVGARAAAALEAPPAVLAARRGGGAGARPRVPGAARSVAAAYLPPRHRRRGEEAAREHPAVIRAGVMERRWCGCGGDDDAPASRRRGGD